MGDGRYAGKVREVLAVEAAEVDGNGWGTKGNLSTTVRDFPFAI